MATACHAAPVVAVDSVELDAALIRETVAPYLPSRKNPERLVAELLERLSRVRLRRENRGLNHWEEFAPAYLRKLLEKIEARRRLHAAEFYRENHARAMAFAVTYLRNREDAEDAVGEAYLKLLQGETELGLFMRALKQVILNRLTRAKVEDRLFVSLDRMMDEDGARSEQEVL